MRTQGYNQEHIQSMNRTLLLNMLRKEGECSRVHLSELSSLKQATVTNIISDFIEWGLVKETGFLIGSKGRRSIGISIDNDKLGTIAIRIARKNYSIGIFDLSGNCRLYHTVKLSQNQKPNETIQQIIETVSSMLDQTTLRMLAIGISFPGPFNTKRGRIELMTGTMGWNEIDLRQTFEDSFNLPVYLEQDANAGALAQYWFNQSDITNGMIVYIAAGQGIGAGIINNGTLMRGDIGTAGEIGHTSISFSGPRCVCGNYGCLEQYCSSIAFEKEVNKTLNTTYTLEEITEKAQNGDSIIQEIYLSMCEKLAVGIINVINNFNPSLIVIGDEMAHVLPDKMLERVKDSVKNRVLPEIYENTRIIMSVVKKDSMLHGAAVVAITEVFKDPLRFIR